MAATYVLGPFRLDAETDTLFRGGEPISLGHRAVALLRVLVERRGIPVSKDALMEAAWAGGQWTVFNPESRSCSLPA